MVPGCRYTPYTTGRVVSRAHFLTEGVFVCDIAHSRSVAELCMAVEDQLLPEASSLLYSTLAVCASAGYTRFSGSLSVYLLDSSLHNLSVPQDHYSLSVSLWHDLADPNSMVWYWRLSRAGPMLLYWPKLFDPFFVFYFFTLSLLPVYRLVLWG